MTTKEVISQYFERIREEADPDPFDDGSSIHFYTERFITLPNAVQREWDTYSPEQQANVEAAMKELDRRHRLAVMHIKKMDKALRRLSGARDNLGSMIPPCLEERLNQTE